MGGLRLATSDRAVRPTRSPCVAATLHPGPVTLLRSLPALHHHLADAAARLHQRVRALEGGGVDRAEAGVERGLELACIHPPRHLVEQAALLSQVRGGEHRAGEHELPVDGHALALERHDVELLGVVDQREAALRRDQFGDVGQVPRGLRGAEHEGGCAQAEGLQLRCQRLAVIEDVMGAHALHPVARFGTRGGGDDGESGQLPRKLRGDGAHPARAADDEQRGRGAGHGATHVQPVEQRLPRGDGGQRQRRGLGEVEAGGHVADEAFVHAMQRGVGAGPGDVARVVHAVAGAQARGLGAGGQHGARGVPAQHLPLARGWCAAGAHFHVDGVH